MGRHHDFTEPCWGHNVESIDAWQFASWSTPRVKPGDTISYITHDKRRVTYRVRKKNYHAPHRVTDMAVFTVKKKRISNEQIGLQTS